MAAPPRQGVADVVVNPTRPVAVFPVLAKNDRAAAAGRFGLGAIGVFGKCRGVETTRGDKSRRYGAFQKALTEHKPLDLIIVLAGTLGCSRLEQAAAGPNRTKTGAFGRHPRE